MAKERSKESEQGRAEQDRQGAQERRRGGSEQRGLARSQGGARSQGSVGSPVPVAAFDYPSALTFASPFALMRRFMEDLDGLFEGMGNAPVAAPSGAGQAATRAGNGDVMWIPAVEIEERDGQLVIRAEIPGVPREQISVEIDDDRLVLSGERVQEHEERRGGVYRSERVYGRFYRVIPLPDGVDPEQARATFANGVLEVTMPLQQQAETAHRIEVQEGQASGQQGQLGQASQEQQATH